MRNKQQKFYNPLLEKILDNQFEVHSIYESFGIDVPRKLFILIYRYTKIKTIGDLLSYRVREILAIPNIGKRYYEFIRKFIEDLNKLIPEEPFHLGMIVDNVRRLNQLLPKKPPYGEPIKWERVMRTVETITMRLPVFGGWLIQLDGRKGICGFFMPDPEHRWDTTLCQDDLMEIDYDDKD